MVTKINRFLSTTSTFAVLAVVMGFVLVIAACSSDPTPAPTVTAPTPTVTSVPTAVPTPVPATATSTPIPATATPTSVPIPVDQLVITETSTVRDLMSPLSGDEIACVRETIGPEIFDTIQDIPLPSLPTDAGELPWQCVSPEKAIGIQVAILSASVGGLSAETRSCITGVAVENPSVLGIGEPPASFGEVFSGAIRRQLCLTDEEAAAWAASQGAELPSPSALRCLEEQLGGEEALLAMLADEEQAEQAMLNLFSAALACEPGQPMATPSTIPIDINELEITETTTFENLLTAFSSSEVECIRNTLGPETVDAIHNAPFVLLPYYETSLFPTECLSSESGVGFVVATMSADAGGFSAETRSCISGIATENPSSIGIGAPTEHPFVLFAKQIQMQLCLTDEEAAIYAARWGRVLPPLSHLQCLEEQYGEIEVVLAALTDPEPENDATRHLLAVIFGCSGGIE